MVLPPSLSCPPSQLPPSKSPPPRRPPAGFLKPSVGHKLGYMCLVLHHVFMVCVYIPMLIYTHVRGHIA